MINQLAGSMPASLLRRLGAGSLFAKTLTVRS